MSGNSTPLLSPAGSKTNDEHAQKVPQQQNLNLDHLHDTLRKSLTKGSDYARTPANFSPSAIDNSEREKMVKALYRGSFLLKCFVNTDFIQKKYFCNMF